MGESLGPTDWPASLAYLASSRSVGNPFKKNVAGRSFHEPFSACLHVGDDPSWRSGMKLLAGGVMLMFKKL